MKITVNEKEYTIKFGYKATVKSGIIKKMAQSDNGDELDSLENTLLLIPEMLTVGLQVHHSDEFGYNLDTNEGYDNVVDKAYDLIEKYLEDANNSLFGLYQALESELVSDSFLSSLFQSAKAEGQKAQKKATKKN